MVPYHFWKGGGDTITDLLDRFQERLGQRSENNVAVARLILYFVVAFHRGNQWCTADMKFPYPTLAHCRNANNKRFAMEDSIDLLIDMLLDVVKAEESQTLLEAVACTFGLDSTETPLPMEQFTLLPQEPAAAVHDKERRHRSTSKQRTPQAPGLPAPSVVSGQTPRMRAQKPVQTHVDRCRKCVGIYLAKVDTIGTLGDVKKKKKKKKKTDDRTRRNCEHCGTRTDYICLGCRRFCCFSAPSEKKTGKKHPKHFSVQTPIINPKTGKLRRERRSGDVVHETAVCQWTCYHALHREAWETYTEGNKYQILATARGERSEVHKKSRRKRKKGTLKTIKEGKDEDNSDGESEEELYDSESDEESVSESEEDSDSGSDEDSDEDNDNDQNDGRIAIQNNGRKRGRSRMSK